MIRLAQEFSRYPGGRFRAMGPFSGEAFRDDLLVPALSRAIGGSGGPVVVLLDGAAGYPASFLEEAFGGLIRAGQFSPAEIRDHLKVVSHDARYAVYRQLAEKYLQDEIERIH